MLWDLFLIKKIAKKCNLWDRKQYTYALFTVDKVNYYGLGKKKIKKKEKKDDMITNLHHGVCLDWAYFYWNWKHCSEIIFKCVNSVVRPIFNKKIVKKCNLWDLKGTQTWVSLQTKRSHRVFCPNPTQAESVSPPLLTRKSSISRTKKHAKF